MQWYLKVLKNYAVFSGRARRKEYWMFILFNLIFSIVANIIDYIFGTRNIVLTYGLFSGLYTLVVLIPSLAVAVRRLHDVGKSGWFMIFILVPLLLFSYFAGAYPSDPSLLAPMGITAVIFFGIAIWMLVLFCTEGEVNDNKWGPNPKNSEQNFESTGVLDGDLKV